MIGVNELRRGVTFTMDNELYKVLEYQHHKPGRGKAVIRTTLRNLRTGSTIQHNFISGDRVQDIRVERRGVQYLYTDGDLYHFMDTETYEQTALSTSVLGDQVRYLKEGMELILSTYEGEALDVEMPTTVELGVIVEQGDVIRVDTRTGEYVTRV
jgi:elongation factor P